MMHIGQNGDVLSKTIPKALEKNNLVLLSDRNYTAESPNFICKNIELYNSQENQKFVGNYEHLSGQPLWHERFCFERWFVLLEFMKQENIDCIFHADSDMMIYSDMTEEFEKYKQYYMTLVYRSCGASSFITKEALQEFCDYVNELYENKDTYEFSFLKSKWESHKEFGVNGGVCDMTLLEMFHKKKSPSLIGEMMQVIDDSTYDHALVSPDGVYEHNGSIKNIKFVDGVPYCYHKNLKRDVRFNVLHFQGDKAKQLLMSGGWE